MWRNRTKPRLYILIQDHTVVSEFVKFGYVILEYRELLYEFYEKHFPGLSGTGAPNVNFRKVSFRKTI